MSRVLLHRLHAALPELRRVGRFNQELSLIRTGTGVPEGEQKRPVSRDAGCHLQASLLCPWLTVPRGWPGCLTAGQRGALLPWSERALAPEPETKCSCPRKGPLVCQAWVLDA